METGLIGVEVFSEAGAWEGRTSRLFNVRGLRDRGPFVEEEASAAPPTALNRMPINCFPAASEIPP